MNNVPTIKGKPLAKTLQERKAKCETYQQTKEAQNKDTLIELEKFPIFLTSSERTIRTRDHIIYATRKFTPDRLVYNKYRNNVHKHLRGCDKETQELMKAHLNRLKEADTSERSYKVGIGGISVDEKNELELMGAVAYAKPYQCVYDMSLNLDILLAYLSGLEYNVLCERLQVRLDEYDVPYSVLSTAIMNNDTSLLSKIPLEIFSGLSVTLDKYLERMLASDSQCILTLRKKEVNLTEYGLSDSERFYSLISIPIWELLQYIFEEFVNIYNRDLLFNDEPSYYITSKGYANVVIQLDAFTVPKSFNLGLNGQVFEVSPLVVKRGHYYKVFTQM